MSPKIYAYPALLCAACVVVGVLAAAGRFNSMIGFPLVFGAVCLALGLLSLWRDPGPRPSRAAIVLAGVAFVIGGWLYQQRMIEERMAATEREVFAELGGNPAPRLVALEPLNTGAGVLREASSFTAPATILSFWATWCSPCWVEMAELQELYERHREKGLTILALTAYDQPDTEEGRRKDREKAEKFLSKRGFEYPAAITAEGANYGAYRVLSIPSSALIDGQGNLVAYAVGLDSARDLMKTAESMVTAARLGAP